MTRLVALTFDLDLTDHVTGAPALEELTDAVPALLTLLDERQWPATWFIRLDAHIRAVYGDAEFVFRRHGSLIDRVLARGDEIGWHPHVYRMRDGEWQPEPDVSAVRAELEVHAPMARARNLHAARMGWGVHTNDTMRFIAASGFSVDSSAIPRPAYGWDPEARDWTMTPLTPYRPSSADYRIPGDPRLPVVEVPMSVVHIAGPDDSQRVMRCVNPAFRPEALAAPLRSWCAEHEVLVTVTHPYEVLPRRQPHPLLAGSIEAFARNLDAIASEAIVDGRSACFVPISAMAAVAA
jgi:hypothetical protein